MIVITVPHSYCIKTKKRSCDTVASYSALMLQKELLKVKTECVIIESEANRIIEYDDNRFSSHIVDESSLWRKLREELKNVDEKKVIVIDMHSFPDKSFDGFDVVFLDNYPYQNITKDMLEVFLKNKINCAILPASTGNNAIIDVLTLHPKYIRAVLVEINEKYFNILEEEYKKIINVLAIFLHQTLNKH